MFGTNASPTDLANCENALAAGQSLADQQAGLRQAFSHSAAETAAVSGLYKDVLGRAQAPSQGEVAAKEDAIANGASLADIRADMAKSHEAVARISQLYTDVLGRKDGADPQGLAGYQGQLASGAMTMDQVRSDLANSKGGARVATSAFQAILNRAPRPDEVASLQSMLAQGQSLGQVRVYLATSAESTVRIGGIYSEVLGRVADPNEIAAWQAQLDANATLTQIQAEIAVSPEALQLRSFMTYIADPSREGERLQVYPDSEGIPTVGVGHKVLPQDNLQVGQTITQAQSDAFLRPDAATALDAARAQMKQAGITDPNFLNPLASVNFQLGAKWNQPPKGFVQTWADIVRGDYNQAAIDAGDSTWAQQTPNRVAEFQNALRALHPQPQ